MREQQSGSQSGIGEKETLALPPFQNIASVQVCSEPIIRLLMFRSIAFVGILAGILLGGCARADLSADMVDARAILPDSALQKEIYVRHYMLLSVKSLDRDLPFTSQSATGDLPAPRRVWVGVFARTPGTWTNAPAGVYIVDRRSEFPEYVHGGCQAINIVADARTGETLSSWCNPDDSQDQSAPTPWYNATGSPFS